MLGVARRYFHVHLAACRWSLINTTSTALHRERPLGTIPRWKLRPQTRSNDFSPSNTSYRSRSVYQRGTRTRRSAVESTLFYTRQSLSRRGAVAYQISKPQQLFWLVGQMRISQRRCAAGCAHSLRHSALYPRITKPCIPSSEGVKAFSEHYKTSYSALAARLFGLGTGKSQRDVVKISAQSDHQSQYLANKYRWYDFIYNFCILYYIISYTNFIIQAETPKLAICASSSIELALTVRTALF